MSQSGFVLEGKKPPFRTRLSEDYQTNSQKTVSSLNLSASLNMSKGVSPSIEELQQSVDNLKLDMRDLNRSLQAKYGNSKIYHDADVAMDEGEVEIKTRNIENPELTFMLQREDKEAVSHLADSDPRWFSEPQHLVNDGEEYPTMQSIGMNERTTQHINRSNGRLGAEIATKDLDGELNAVELADNSEYFPVRLTAPHVVGVRSLLPPKFSVRAQNPERTKSLHQRSKSVEPKILIGGQSTIQSTMRSNVKSRNRTPSPKPVWMPTTPKPKDSGAPLPKFTHTRGRTRGRHRPASAGGYISAKKLKRDLLSSALTITKPYNPTRYQRPQVQTGVELKFLKAADELDTRSNLVENSPYQQALSKLRLERLRVEENYLLQLKRESELERIRGPKPKWYETKGPQFHYECNKNTTLHKNPESWADTLEYRRKLLTSSREFASNLKGPVLTTQ